ncbi:hypothetical protein [Lederbergia graminis]|uniref:DUF2157 domain-containing protein n=1 Tax=Lederbergia graminis TaxID=735518 RepID=A0ABW0LLR8_9BACI|nr:hypothetical protein [Paenibacillus bovis]
MNETRKKIILNEIEFWKQNNMLPEQYCDYLLALYSGGDIKTESQKRHKNDYSELYVSLLFLLMIISSIVITYITDFSFGMQTLFLSICCFLLVLAYYFFRKKGKKRLVIYITAAFLLLIYSVQINDTFFNANEKSLQIILFFHGFVWLFTGVWRKLHFFTVSGIIAICVILFTILT